MEPTGPHEQVLSLVGRKLNVEIDRQDLPYFIPHRCLIKLLGTNTAFCPDVIVLDQTELINEPLWQQEPVITSGKSIKLIAEILSRELVSFIFPNFQLTAKQVLTGMGSVLT
ncbi:hypothetical protein NIES932_02970 [Raphidiopsis curvata NIES-932]|nr:hypothetical protein NIES932_02970 [Raphidiopsis curvata NIES-932]